MAYDKTDLLYNCVALGMDLKRAYYAAELTQEEMDHYDNDPVFQRRAAAKNAILEKQLLEKLDMVMDMNLREGNSKELRFKLGAINSKWRNQGGGAQPQAGVVNIFTKDYELAKEDTVEIQESGHEVSRTELDIIRLEDQ